MISVTCIPVSLWVCVCVCVKLVCLWECSNHITWNIRRKSKRSTLYIHIQCVVLVCAITEWNLLVSFTLCQAELQKLRQQVLETKHFIEKQEAEERKLLRIIAEADGERLRQKKELDQVGTSCQTCRPLQQVRCLIQLFTNPHSSLSSLIQSDGRATAEAHLLLIDYDKLIHLFKSYLWGLTLCQSLCWTLDIHWPKRKSGSLHSCIV